MLMSDSEFAKWRTLVALVHADGRVEPEEVNMLHLQFKRVKFTDAQMEQLHEDMKNPKNPKFLYKQVTEKQDREDLLQLAYVLFWSDSDFDEAEVEIYQYLQDNL